MNAIELVAVTAGYGPYRALAEASLSVADAEVVALVGPNGAGKSTVARVCSGLVVPSSGRLLVGGKDLTGAPPWRIARAQVASVPEGRGVFARLSVAENLELSFGRWLGPAAVPSALEATFERFPMLAGRRRQAAGTLSGGQQRLLSLAKVLGDSPRVVVADELSLGLSPAAADDIYEQLGALQRAGTALLVIEQQTDRVFELADRAVVLDRGSVAFSGSPAGASAVVRGILGVTEGPHLPDRRVGT
ncbi:MAG TPA: ATP-binding cassette domain-containing protein [Acidimicrobiales bacterium]|nr:ATP-binding cassette domain-containing protein [Acidimicrobiales bacterium]